MKLIELHQHYYYDKLIEEIFNFLFTECLTENLNSLATNLIQLALNPKKMNQLSPSQSDRIYSLLAILWTAGSEFGKPVRNAWLKLSSKFKNMSPKEAEQTVHKMGKEMATNPQIASKIRETIKRFQELYPMWDKGGKAEVGNRLKAIRSFISGLDIRASAVA